MIDEAFYIALKAQIGSLMAYPVLATENAVAPFVVYQRTGTIRDRSQAGDTGRIEAIYRIDVYHKQLLMAQGIAENIVTGLSQYSAAPIRFVVIEGEQDASDISGDPALYRWMIDARVVASK